MGFEQEFADELVSRVTVGRVSVDETDTTATVPPRTVTVVESEIPFVLRELRSSFAQTPHGTEEQATHRGYGAASRDVEAGDVMRVDSGPDAGTYFRVQRPYRPQNHHLEVDLVVDEGEKERASDEPWVT